MTDGRFHVVPLCRQDVPAFVQPFWDTHYHSLIGRWSSPKLGFPTRLRCPIVPSRKHRGYEAFSLARGIVVCEGNRSVGHFAFVGFQSALFGVTLLGLQLHYLISG